MLIGTVDSNQVIVSAQVEGRIQKLLVDEGTPVKAGDLIAVLDPSELQTQEAAATATITSLQHKVSEMQHTEQSTSGSTSSDVANAQAKLSSAKAQLLQAKATLDRTESDSRRMIELAKAGVASDQERVQAETNLASSTSHGAGSARIGESGGSRSEFRDRPHAAGQRCEEHGAIDRSRSEKRHRSEKSSCGSAGLYERLRACYRHGFCASGAGKEKWSISARRS